MIFKSQLSENAKKRINILKSSNDGFEISEQDMKLRGYGDILGFKQSGIKKFKLADPILHKDLFDLAEEEVKKIENNIGQVLPQKWVEFKGGITEVGAFYSNDFIFDNETPRHKVFLAPFYFSSHLVTNRDFLEFIQNDGYERHDLWLSDGWAHLKSLGQNRWKYPLYWFEEDNVLFEYTLQGPRPLDLDAPLCHVSAYEADAFARWKGARLPTEQEWEFAASDSPVSGNFLSSGYFHPTRDDKERFSGFYGDVWEWTSSSYSPYPGFSPFEGSLGEYNGKFMSSQLVLRGGSCVSSHDHIRKTYRNFFYPRDRWQFSGIRLAKDSL